MCRPSLDATELATTTHTRRYTADRRVGARLHVICCQTDSLDTLELATTTPTTGRVPQIDLCGGVRQHVKCCHVDSPEHRRRPPSPLQPAVYHRSNCVGGFSSNCRTPVPPPKRASNKHASKQAANVGGAQPFQAQPPLTWQST